MVLPAPAPGRRLLSSAEIALTQAIADALFPPGSPLPFAAADHDVAGELDRVLAEDLDPEMRLVFRYLARALDLGTLASRGAHFANLDRATRIEVLATWSDAGNPPRRMAYEGIKLVISIAALSMDAAAEATGWVGGCFHPRVQA
jgi:hypothetical protein